MQLNIPRLFAALFLIAAAGIALFTGHGVAVARRALALARERDDGAGLKANAMERFDAIVIGGGVIGTSIAMHLARFGAGRVLLLERGTLGGGTSAQSSCIVRTHYSVAANVALAQAALAIFGIFRTISTTPRPIADSTPAA
jgi:hypothetical protein